MLAETSDYDGYWQVRRPETLSTVSLYRRRRFAALRRWIGPGASILDVGCGDGVTMEYLARHCAPNKLVGLDGAQATVRMVRERGFEVICADVRDPATQRDLPEFDYIIATELIEHIQEAEALLRFMLSKARRSVIISIPNTGYIGHRLRLGLGRFPLQWRRWPGEHVRFWTVKDFRWWSRQLGLRILRQAPYEGLPGRRLWPNLLAHGVLYEMDGGAQGNEA